jgi:hypothetical protein
VRIAYVAEATPNGYHRAVWPMTARALLLRPSSAQAPAGARTLNDRRCRGHRCPLRPPHVRRARAAARVTRCASSASTPPPHQSHTIPTRRARSSVGERSLHTREVGGSKPPAPIAKGPQMRVFCIRDGNRKCATPRPLGHTARHTGRGRPAHIPHSRSVNTYTGSRPPSCVRPRPEFPPFPGHVTFRRSGKLGLRA